MESTVYWAVVRNADKRMAYIEISSLGNNKWNVLLDDNEFTLRSQAQSFWELLEQGLQHQKDIS
jgi:hypothetical protein